jgi:hypothetical protein
MATMDDAAIAEAKREIGTRMLRLTLWKLRDMRRSWPRPRTLRLPAQARALRSVVREAQAAGLIPPQPAPHQPRRRSRPPPQ